MTNENSVSEQWLNGWLRGEQTKARRNWGDMPPAYGSELDGLWNGWLSRKYAAGKSWRGVGQGTWQKLEDAGKGTVRRLRPEGFAAASRPLPATRPRSCNGLEKDFFAEMKSYPSWTSSGPNSCCSAAPITTARWSGLPMIAANAVLDVTDNHFYWQHPIFPTDERVSRGRSIRRWSATRRWWTSLIMP